MRIRRRASVELLLALLAAAGAGWCWVAARSTVEVAPVLDGEPKTTSVVYYPPLLVLMLMLATVAGVLAVVAIARLRCAAAPVAAETEVPVAERDG
jgi:hypothetical protein